MRSRRIMLMAEPRSEDADDTVNACLATDRRTGMGAAQPGLQPQVCTSRLGGQLQRRDAGSRPSA